MPSDELDGDSVDDPAEEVEEDSVDEPAEEVEEDKPRFGSYSLFQLIGRLIRNRAREEAEE